MKMGEHLRAQILKRQEVCMHEKEIIIVQKIENNMHYGYASGYAYMDMHQVISKNGYASGYAKAYR